MILDLLNGAERLPSLCPGFAAAFDFLCRTDLARLDPGRIELIPNKLYANVEKTAGRGRAASPLEAHRKFIDIQYTVAGGEEIGWRDLASCAKPRGPFDDGRDIGFFDDDPLAWFPVPPGYFAIFLPGDAHAPLAGTGPLHKVVMKVAVDWGA